MRIVGGGSLTSAFARALPPSRRCYGGQEARLSGPLRKERAKETCHSTKRTHFFSRTFRRIIRKYKGLCRLQRRLQMGSFWKNEPIWDPVIVLVFGSYLTKEGSTSGRLSSLCPGGEHRPAWRRDSVAD